MTNIDEQETADFILIAFRNVFIKNSSKERQQMNKTVVVIFKGQATHDRTILRKVF
ncbi:hypothetical protein P4U97_05335 [Bacillus swezeyi]|uniref:hypothetical protein n=1 Tax=Bacillus swezeyi TaxID=1925020 RepID=UPI002E218280|nr:hypothetical protein [Bacillus swezeyi]